jgi:hypothetical protein
VSSGAGGARVSSMPPAGASYPPDTLRGQEGAGEPAADFGAVASTLHQIEQPDVHGRHPTCRSTHLGAVRCRSAAHRPRRTPRRSRSTALTRRSPRGRDLAARYGRELEAIASRLLDRLPGKPPQALPPQEHGSASGGPSARRGGPDVGMAVVAWSPCPHLGQCPRVRCQLSGVRLGDVRASGVRVSGVHWPGCPASVSARSASPSASVVSAPGDFVERVGASDGHTARAMGLAALPYPRIARATSPSQRRGL